MPAPPRDDRPPLAVAMQWVSQITTISFSMAGPPLLGYWLDDRWGISPWLTVTGAILGFAVAMIQLIQLTRRKPSG